MESGQSVRSIIDRGGSTATGRRVLVIAAMLMAIEAYDMNIVGLVAPSLMHDLQVSQSMFGWHFSLTLLSYLIGSAYVGGMADIYGRRLVIIGGMVTLGALTIPIAAVDSLWQLVVLRFLSGVGLGATIPAIVALTTEFGPSERRGRRVGLIYVGFMLGGVFTGAIAYMILKYGDWRALFLIGGGLPLIMAALIWWLLPESPFYLLQRPERRSALLAVMRQIDGNVTDSDVEASTANVAARRNPPMGLLLVKERRAQTLILWASFVVNFMTLYFITSWLPTLLVRSGYDLSQSASLSSVLMLGGIGGCALIGSLIDRFGIGAVWVIMAGTFPAIVSIGMVAGQAWMLVVAMLAVGFFMQGGLTGMNALAGLLYPPEIRSTSTGSAYGIGRIGSMAGPLAGGILLSENIATTPLLAIAATPLLIGTIGAFSLWRLRRRSWFTRASS